MARLNICRIICDELSSFHSSYQFSLNINLNVRWLHLLKLGYLAVLVIIMFLVYLTGGWNYKEVGVSSIVIVVKGAALSHGMVWDATDYVYPPQEVKAFFISTRAVMTSQVQGICPDKMNCTENAQCMVKRRTEYGIRTGECDKKAGKCLIQAWCPLEDYQSNLTKITHIKEAINFTVYVRDHEEFIKFNTSISNDPRSEKSSTNCLFHSIEDPTCPNFKIADILKKTNVNFKDVVNLGGIFQFYIKWHCFFNWNSGPCIPKYSFKRIARDNMGKFSGYRMRYSFYQEENGIQRRQLITAYGLRFLIMIKSRAEQFTITAFLSSVGSYLSYFGIWTFITGILCYLLLQEKSDLMYLDESVVRNMVEENNKIKKKNSISELKELKKRESESELNVALVSNC